MKIVIKELEIGFTFIMDYNEDRQVTSDTVSNEKKQFNLGKYVLDIDQNQQLDALMYLDTIG